MTGFWGRLFGFTPATAPDDGIAAGQSWTFTPADKSPWPLPAAERAWRQGQMPTQYARQVTGRTA